MSISRASVFDKFTFFGVLVPGIFSSVLLFPFLPDSFVAPLVGVIVYIVTVSFVFGMFLNGLAEPLESLNHKWWLADAVDIFAKVNNGLEVPMGRNQSDIDKSLADRCIEYVGHDLGIDDWKITNLKSGTDYNREDFASIYQYVLNEVWAGRGSPAKIHHSVRMLCRSLVAACIGIFIVASVVVGVRFVGLLPYNPVYATTAEWMGDADILIIYTSVLPIVGAAAIYIHRQYTYYLCMYMISEFVQRKNDI